MRALTPWVDYLWIKENPQRFVEWMERTTQEVTEMVGRPPTYTQCEYDDYAPRSRFRFVWETEGK